MRILAIVTIVLAATGCSSSSKNPPPEVAAGANPLVTDDALTPFPSTVHEVKDTSSATGWRVHLDPSLLPEQTRGKSIDPTRLNQHDGFSPSMPFLVYFKAGVDQSQLPTADQGAESMMPSSAVQIIDYADGSRVPVMAELDANVLTGDRQGLIIRPLVRLKGGARYIVALVGLRDGAGKPLQAIGFQALRDRDPLSKSLQPLQARYEEIFAKLDGIGLPRKSLTLAWDVITASEDSITSRLVKMRDAALATLTSGGPHYTIPADGITDNPMTSVLRQIRANVKVPSFLADDSGTSTLNFGADGQPAIRAVVDVPIVINIPKCVTDEDPKTPGTPLWTLPRPSVVFGHGLFGNALDTLSSSDLAARANSYCGIYLATDWIGLSSGDVKNIANLLGADLNNTWVITDRLQQAHVNAQVMTRVFLTEIIHDDAMKVTQPGAAAAAPVTDGVERYYFGVSNGGIQGGTFMALNEDIAKGVLNVPGCEWSLLIFRSADFGALRPLLTSALHDAIDQQVAIMLTQPEWDYTDPASFAPHLLQNPVAGAPAKKILVQESEGDAQVSNLATRVLARTMGLSGFDLTTPVFGIPTAAAPLDSAYTQWNSNPSMLPPTSNTALKDDNGAHNAVWRSDLGQAQIRAYLTPTGQATSVCNGPCMIPQ